MMYLVMLAILFGPLALFGWLLCAYEALLDHEYARDREEAWWSRRWQGWR